MDELLKRLDQLKPVVKIDDLYEKRLPDIANTVVATSPIPMTR
jgi:hypothetical protein